MESFNGEPGDGLRDREEFATLGGATVLVEGHRLAHNHGRPHRALNDMTPAAFAASSRRGGHTNSHSDWYKERGQGNRGYDSEPHRRQLRARGSRPLLAKRNAAHGSGLGVYRWVVERAESWLHQNRHLKFRYDRRDDIHEAFPAVDCALICLNCLTDPFC